LAVVSAGAWVRDFSPALTGKGSRLHPGRPPSKVSFVYRNSVCDEPSDKASSYKCGRSCLSISWSTPRNLCHHREFNFLCNKNRTSSITFNAILVTQSVHRRAGYLLINPSAKYAWSFCRRSDTTGRMRLPLPNRCSGIGSHAAQGIRAGKHIFAPRSYFDWEGSFALSPTLCEDLEQVPSCIQNIGVGGKSRAPRCFYNLFDAWPHHRGLLTIPSLSVKVSIPQQA